MKHPYYQDFRLFLGRALAVLGLLAGGAGGALAQSGPYGNEWIVPGQTYYKLQTTQHGLYHLDYAYLTRAGLAPGTDLSRLQLWRRGQQVALNVLGSVGALDAGSVVQFFGQRNDAALDRGLFKRARDQAQPYFSFYTDTAAYFLTVGAAPGKRMGPGGSPAAAPATYWLNPQLRVLADRYQDIDSTAYLFQPWAEPNEGFFSNAVRTGNTLAFTVDSLRQVAADGPAPRLDIQVVGASRTPHTANLYVQPPTGDRRLLGTVSFGSYSHVRLSYGLLRSDIGPTARRLFCWRPPAPRWCWAATTTAGWPTCASFIRRRRAGWPGSATCSSAATPRPARRPPTTCRPARRPACRAST